MYTTESFQSIHGRLPLHDPILMKQDSPSAHAGSRLNGATKPSSASNSPRSLEEVAVELRRKVLDLLQLQANDELLRNLQKQIRISLEVIEESFRKYRPEELSLSYNGGKDCLVLLVLILACLPSSKSTFSSFPDRLQSIFIIPYDSFPEVEEFVATSTREYSLELSRYVLPMRPALDAYLNEKPNIKAIWIGTRRVDPNGGQLTHFDYTDKDWPQFMRIHPVIDWHYAEIWAFIRHLGLEYCPLYDRGFTSLGGVSDTQPNPALAIENDPTRFRPAYELKEDNEERLGRDR